MKLKRAREVVLLLLDDLNGRSGYDNLWDGLDEEIASEIIESLTEILIDEAD